MAARADAVKSTAQTSILSNTIHSEGFDSPTSKSKDNRVWIKRILVDLPVLEVPLWHKLRGVVMRCGVIHHVPYICNDNGSLGDNISIVYIFFCGRMWDA